MDNCFSGDKRGRNASENHEDKIAAIVEDRYKKLCIKSESKNTSIETQERIEKYNEYLRDCIEERVRNNAEE